MSIPFNEPVDVLVVIVCYRAPELTIDCLRSLEPEVRAIPGLRVGICENGTGPESIEKLERAIEDNGWRDWVWLKAISPNRGFCGGNNAIIREAMTWEPRPRHFILLNADTIVRDGALASLLDAAARHPEAGIIGPRLEHLDGEPQVSMFRDFTPWSELITAADTGPITRMLRRYEVPIHEPDGAITAGWTSFACALIRARVFEEAGLLDDDYYLYFDDPDLCRRARQAGWGVLYWPSARVVHLVGKSNPAVSLKAARKRRPRYYYESRSRYFAKFYGRPGLWLANLMWTCGRSVSLARELLTRRESAACEREWLDIWTNATRPLQPWRSGQEGVRNTAAAGVAVSEAPREEETSV